MKKIFYWSPHISRVATIRNVLNSAIALAKYDKNKTEISIIDAFGEWKKFKEKINFNRINYIKLASPDLSHFLPISGYFKGRVFYLIIFFFNIFKLKQLLLKLKPDYLIVHLITSIPLILLLNNKFHTKFILRISGLPKLNLLRKLLWKKISKKISLVTCPSLETKILIEKLDIFPKEKIVVLYDPILSVKSINKNLSIKKDYELHEKKYFLNIGRLTSQKNQSLLIEAFSQIKNESILLYIAGDGEKKKYLSKLIKLKKLENKVFLLGQIDNVFPLIKNSIAVISTSLWEDPGAVMIESAFCNKTIICSNCPNGPKEFTENGKGGYLFINNSKLDLSNKIKDFINDDDSIKFEKKIVSKKNSKKYSLFRHYKQLNKLLNLYV